VFAGLQAAASLEPLAGPVLMSYMRTKYLSSSYNYSLIIFVKPNVKENIRTVALILHSTK
jgi:hypothetical protein